MSELISWASLLALLNLTLLEIILGVDNILFISILSDRLPKKLQAKGRKAGLMFTLLTRLLLLACIKFIADMKSPLFTLFEQGFSFRDLVLLGGGLFLLFKGTLEIYNVVEEKPHEKKEVKGLSFMSFLFQIALIDIVFSLDSVITAIGLTSHLPLMVIAIVTSIIIMLFFTEWINTFINDNPSLKLLALSFLIVLGVILVADGFGTHINRGYIYFAMGFTIFIELLKLRKKYHLKKSTQKK